MVGRVAEAIFIPFTVGGGIRSVADAGAALRAGADKISVNTAAVRDPSLVSALADSFGSQCVVVAVDVRRVNGRMAVMVNGGREETPLEAVEWTSRLASLGAGEILLTSMDRDGTGKGYDLPHRPGSRGGGSHPHHRIGRCRVARAPRRRPRCRSAWRARGHDLSLSRALAAGGTRLSPRPRFPGPVLTGRPLRSAAPLRVALRL